MELPSTKSKIEILFQDNDLLIVNKPVGIPVHPTLDRYRPSVEKILEENLQQKLFLFHRLDVDTSGVLVFAKNKLMIEQLQKIQEKNELQKTYWGIVNRTLFPSYGKMEDFLSEEKIQGKERVIKVFKGGKKAITLYRVLERFADESLIEFTLITGRKHQIRIQSAVRGCPLVGDKLYDDKKREKDFSHFYLHAQKLVFIHPVSLEKLTIEAPIPENFNQKIESLRKSTSKKFRYIALHRPYGVLSQFTSEKGVRNLSEFNLPKGVYACGRLDKDSEGLLLLTNDGTLIEYLLNPENAHERTYYAQVEGVPSLEDLKQLSSGLKLKDYTTLPCLAKIIPDPGFDFSGPALRKRCNSPTSWLELKLIEGKNRQIRHMTAAINHPTLRLVRVAIGNLLLDSLKPGEWRELADPDVIFENI